MVTGGVQPTHGSSWLIFYGNFFLFYPIATGAIWRAEIMEEGEQEVGVEKEEMEAAVG